VRRYAKPCDDKTIRPLLNCYDAGNERCFGAILYGMVQGHKGMNKTRYMVSCPWADRVDEYLKNKAAA
jgi:hypothetical protein